MKIINQIKTYWLILLLAALFCPFKGAAQEDTNDFSWLEILPPGCYLDSWSFDNTNWYSDFGFTPLSFTNIEQVPDWDGNALQVDATNAAWLTYNIVEDAPGYGAYTNLTLKTGSIEFWFIANWESADTNYYGTGPGDFGRFIDVGTWTTNADSDWWSLYLNPAGTGIHFSSGTNGVRTNYLNTAISWDWNTWHMIVLTYSPTNTILYLDGQLAASGGGVRYVPGGDILTNGFAVGSDFATGMQQAHGQFDDLYTYNYQLSAADVTYDYESTYSELPGTFHPGFEADDAPPGPGGGGGGSGGGDPPTASNYGSNLWIQVQGIITNSFIGIVSNTAPDIQYEIQSIPNLLQTNWNPEGFIYGSEITNWTAMSVGLAGRTNSALFFRIRSWQDSYDIGIPDWWQLEYFGYVGIDPYADPAGDGYSNLYKYQHGMNPFAYYAEPYTSAGATAISGDNGVTITWDPAQGPVLSYTIYKNGSSLITVSSNTFSYTDTSVSIDLTDPNDSDFPYYQVAANYSGASYLGPVQEPSNLKFTIATEIVRGPQGQQILLVPNIPSSVTSIRVYLQGNGEDYPDNAFDSLNYIQPSYSYDPTLSSNYFDVPVGSFTNSQYVIPASLLPPYNLYSISCRALGANGTFGPDNSTALNSSVFIGESEGPCFMPFVDGTEQLRENLAFEMEAADENNAFAFGVAGAESPEVPDYITPTNYACAGFTFPFDFGSPMSIYSFIDPFKPFEDNYFLRNFVFANTNINSDGTLESGVYYDSSQSPPIQIPQSTLFSFPEYDFVTTGNTNDLSPQMSVTANQWIYTAYQPSSPGQGNIGISESGTNLSLNNSRYNIFGLKYQSAYQLYSDGTQTHTNELVAGGSSIPDVSYSESFYGQVAPPQLQTVGYFFGVPFEDYVPGMAGFSPTNTGPAYPQVLAVGEPMLMTAWAKERITNSTSGIYGFLQQYFDKAYLGDSNGNLDTNIPTGILSEYGEFFATAPGKTFLTTEPDANGQTGNLPVYTVAMCTDVNRDGTIDPTFGSPDFTSPAHPFHFWVNDNDDSGDDFGNDIPGYPATVRQTPNSLTGQINGTRDLIDFFPVYVDVHDLLAVMQTNQLYSGLTLRLSQADSALYFAYTSIEPGDPLSYLTDTNIAFGVESLPVTQITSSGVNLNTNFEADILEGNTGIILVEAWTNTSNPLLLDVMQGTNIIAEAPLYLNITGVEQMFRHKNLTAAVAGKVQGPPDRLNDFDVPNEPDTGGNNFIFVHGYNTNPNEARGAQADLFRKLFWSGSQAKFYGVTWDGYSSQTPLFGIHTVTPNYHTNVVNAFITAPQLATFINGLSGTNTMAAHSLGNMVALSALSDWGANVQNYFMIDAAVAIETVDGSVGVNTNMVPPVWYPYDQFLWATYWYQLWSSGDGRNSLTWAGRLSNFGSANVYNFYSSGENVLRTSAGAPPSIATSLFDQTVLDGIFEQNPVGSFVWAWQEKLKGSCLGNWILGSNYGGWGFNLDYSTDTVAQANSLMGTQLQTNAFFNTSVDSLMFTTSASGGTYASANRARILADAVPAVSVAIGANEVPSLGANNFNMQTDYENGWPAAKSTGAEAFNWYHSDYEQVAYVYTHGLFDEFVTLGNLK